MKKTDLTYASSYFDRYIDLVPDISLAEAFRQSIRALDNLDLDKLRALGDQAYAPGKWSVKYILQHLIDVERVFNYRALRFARNDKTLLPGFDEDLFADNCGAERRRLDDILDELRCVRESSEMLFNSFDETALRRTGIAFNAELPALILGYIIIGHQTHHFRVLEERYFPLLQTS